MKVDDSPAPRAAQTPRHGVDVVIIGAGLAGLACARTLHAMKRDFVILEAGDRIGGRVATHLHKGFRIDRGFQVLLTSYPEAKRMLDYDALDLRRFYPGALVRWRGAWHRVADPFRHPIEALRSAFGPIGCFADKWKVGLLRLGGFDFSRHPSDRSTLEALRAEGFSGEMIERFFRPFLGGVFLERHLETTVGKLEFVMRHFAEGHAAVPAKGMAEIPRQLCATLPRESVRLNTRVCAVNGHNVLLDDGTSLRAKAIVIATEAGGVGALLGKKMKAPAFHGVCCLSFAAERAPVGEPILMLNGDGIGPVNNLAVPTVLSQDYAPDGKHLISASLIDPRTPGSTDLEARVRRQMREWFGTGADSWELLRIDHIPRAVPVGWSHATSSVRLAEGLYQCGDHCGIASIDTALTSGSAAARALLEDFP